MGKKLEIYLVCCFICVSTGGVFLAFSYNIITRVFLLLMAANIAITVVGFVVWLWREDKKENEQTRLVCTGGILTGVGSANDNQLLSHEVLGEDMRGLIVFGNQGEDPCGIAFEDTNESVCCFEFGLCMLCGKRSEFSWGSMGHELYGLYYAKYVSEINRVLPMVEQETTDVR